MRLLAMSAKLGIGERSRSHAECVRRPGTGADKRFEIDATKRQERIRRTCTGSYYREKFTELPSPVRN